MNNIEAIQKYPNFLCDDIFNVKFQDKKYENLREIGSVFKPDDHFTGKSSLEKVLSLMDYVHNELFFAGNTVIPDRLNTFSIMKLRKTGAVFCSCYSTVLAEMLLSLGVMAVRISCIPFNFDCDCHVGVLVYLDDICKWAFFDPTFNTFFY